MLLFLYSTLIKNKKAITKGTKIMKSKYPILVKFYCAILSVSIAVTSIAAFAFAPTSLEQSETTIDFDSNPEAIPVDDDTIDTKSLEENSRTSRAYVTTYEIKNLTKANSIYWFPNSPIDIVMVDGPSSVSDQYTRSVSAQYSANLTTPFTTMSSTFGWNYAMSQSKSTTVTASIPSGQKAKIGLYGLYEKYTFDEYRNGMYFSGRHTYYKPIGLKYTLDYYRK